MREFETVEVDADLLLTDGRPDISSAVAKQDLFTFGFGKPGKVQITARGFVGVIPVNDRLTLEVAPRFNTNELGRLVEVSRVPPKALANVMRTYSRKHVMYPSLIGLYAEALLESVLEVTSRGLLREYEWREELSSSPRGRILVGKTMQAATARGARHRAVFGWHQRATDIAANRCLLYAAHRLARYNRRADDVARGNEQRRVDQQLNRCIQLMPGITLDGSREFLRDPLVTGRAPLPSLRRYYRPAIDLATAIIAGQAVDIEDQNGTVRLPSLLLDMPAIFEAYLRNVLARVSVDEGWSARILDGNKMPPAGGGKPNLLDDGEAIKATPDIVLATGDARSPTYRGIIEVKYKPARNQRPERMAIDQTITYGMSYRVDNVVIVQPASEGQISGWRSLGTLRGMKVGLYLFDLSDQVAEAQELQFAHSVRERMIDEA